MPKKMRRAAIRSALSARLADEAVVFVDEIKLDKISTKAMAQWLNTLDAYGRTLIVVEGISNELRLSCRNIPGVDVKISPGISVRDVLNADKIIMTRAAVQKLEEVLA